MKIVKKKSKEYYDRWRKEKTYSPALKADVQISLKGWRHITGGTGHKKRSINDVYRRLKLLPYAKRIIKKSSTIQNVTKRNGIEYYILEAVLDVKERKVKRPRKIRVVLQKDKKGNYIFLSVMDKKKRRKKS